MSEQTYPLASLSAHGCTNSLRGCSSVGHGYVGVLCADSAVPFRVLLTFSIPFHSVPFRILLTTKTMCLSSAHAHTHTHHVVSFISERTRTSSSSSPPIRRYWWMTALTGSISSCLARLTANSGRAGSARCIFPYKTKGSIMVCCMLWLNLHAAHTSKYKHISMKNVQYLKLDLFLLNCSHLVLQPILLTNTGQGLVTNLATEMLVGALLKGKQTELSSRGNTRLWWLGTLWAREC